MEKKKKNTLYTGLGDKGITSLAGGLRVSKTHLRMDACGTVDELNSFIGLLLTEIEDTRIFEILKLIQHTLFAVGSYLATDTDEMNLKPAIHITSEHISQLEQSIDLLYSDLPEMRGFVLPGGCRSAALAHVSRTVCRRAEREIFRLNKEIQIEALVPVYINRLSDLLFVISRHESLKKNSNEIIWNII